MIYLPGVQRELLIEDDHNITGHGTEQDCLFLSNLSQVLLASAEENLFKLLKPTANALAGLK